MNFSEQPILSDFNRFLDYVVRFPNLTLTKDKAVLRSKDLMAIDEMLHFKARKVTPKSQQMAYSVINTFFHIVTVSQMAFVKRDVVKETPYVTLNEARVKEYDALSDVEKYFFLLETFWCYVDWIKSYDCRSFWDTEFYQELMQYPVDKVVTIAEREFKRDGTLRGPSYNCVAEIFEAFGFIDMTWDESLDKRPSSYKFPYATVTPTALGKTLLLILLENRAAYLWHNLDPYNDDREYDLEEEDDFDFEYDEDEDKIIEINRYEDNDDNEEDDDKISEMSKGIIELAEAYMESHEAVENEDFVDAFLPVLEGQLIEKSLYPIVRLKIKGNYLLKVALEKDLYRVLTVGSEHTFQELHWAIQKAYKFDDDHGYSFYMNGEAGSQSGDRFTDPQTLSGGLDGEKPANAYVIGEAGLYEGMQFLYIFDFGDDWRFNITVLSIQEGAKEPKNIKVVETKGKAPKQYDFDEEDENW